MKKITLPSMLFLLGVFSVLYSFSQVKIDRSIVSSSGEYIDNANIKLSYTAGEPVVGTIGNNEMIFTQGFQQPEGKMIKKIKLDNNKVLTFTAFPNPVTTAFNIQISGEEINDLTVEVYDVLGKLIKTNLTKNAVGTQTNMSLSMEQVPPGIYIVKLTSAAKQLNTTYKITKIN